MKRIKPEIGEVHAESNGHKWCMVKFTLTTLESCQVCGIVRRSDDKNSPCKGPVKITRRIALAQA